MKSQDLLLVLIPIVAAGVYFSFYKPSSSSLPPAESSKDQNNKLKVETENKNRSETIKKIKEIILKSINNETETEMESDLINIYLIYPINEETIRPLMRNHFPDWNIFNIKSFSGLIRLGCVLLKLSTNLDINARRYIDAASAIISLIISDFLRGYEAKRTLFENKDVIKALELVGKLFNAYQYIVNTEGNLDPDLSYQSIKYACKENLNILVPQLNFANGRKQEGVNAVIVDIIRLVCLFVSDFSDYKTEIYNRKDDLNILKDAFNEIKNTPSRHSQFNDYDYYLSIFMAFNSWTN